MSVSKIVIQDGTVVTMDSEFTVFKGHDVLIEGNKISAVGKNLPTDGADVIDATDSIVMPGLIDTHMHMWQYPWRQVVSRLWGFGDYAKVFWPIRESYEPQDTFDAIRGCAWEMINHGVTSAVDFFHGANLTPEHVDAAIAAHQQTGQRVQLTYGITTAFDTVDRATFDKARLARIADFDRVRAELGASSSSLLTAGLGLITPNDDLLEDFFEELQHGRASGANMSFHQNRPGEIRAIHEQGLLGADIVPVHSNTISDQELTWMAAANMAIASTPQSEVSLGWSMTVMRRALERGVILGVGVDTPGSLPVDMLGQLRMMYSLLQFMDADVMRNAARVPLNAQDDPQTASFEQVLHAGIGGGAHVLGRSEDLGSVEAGRIADLVVVRPRDPEAALRDPVAHLILATAAATEVDTVLIDGIPRKRDGELVGVDRDELAATNSQVRERVLTRAKI